jgi:hypothetical protein
VRVLGPPWSWLRVLAALPRPLRDAGYDFVARNRYRWFGKKDACPMPRAEWTARFLQPRDEAHAEAMAEALGYRRIGESRSPW